MRGTGPAWRRESGECWPEGAAAPIPTRTHPPAAASAKPLADGGLAGDLDRWCDSDIRGVLGLGKAGPPLRLTSGSAEGPEPELAAAPPQCVAGVPRGSSLGKRRALDDPGAVHVMHARSA